MFSRIYKQIIISKKGSLNLRLPFSMEMGDISFPIFSKDV
jgi:hypothetical protein